jgi:dipeptidyl aminopeptidase/acylaminoacyl peptidase
MMRNARNHYLLGAVCLLPVCTLGLLKRPVLPADCVTVQYVVDDSYHHAIKIAPSGTQVAYLVKSPNLSTNQNDIRLYTKQLSTDSKDPGRLLATEPKITQLHWLDDSRHIVALVNDGIHTEIAEFDTNTSQRKVLAKPPGGVKEFSINGRGDVLVFAVPTELQPVKVTKQTSLELSRGYRVPFQKPGSAALPKLNLFVSTRRRQSIWTRPKKVIVQSPFTGAPLTSMYCQEYFRLSVSPNGRMLLISYIETGPMPDHWKASKFVQQTVASGFPGIHVTVLYDLKTDKTTLPFETPWAHGVPLWSPDSGSFLISAQSPVGSQSETQDQSEHRGSIHLFRVHVMDGRAEEVAVHLANPVEQPLFWSRNGEVLVQTKNDEITRFADQNGAWQNASSAHIPLRGLVREIATDGKSVVGVVESPTIPPEVFSYDYDHESVIHRLALNPRFQQLTIAPAVELDWQTSTGYAVHGLLFVPPSYVRGTRYPLVIQTKPTTGQFVCDSGQDHYPAFAPQPIANAGMMYLIRNGSESIEDQIANAPAGYPGGIGEAAFHMDVWDSAVAKLAADGMVEPEKVGIIGFSRSGWYTEFILSHSKVRYRAATVADNVQYSLGEYWLLHSDSTMRGWETIYGGPPYGPTLRNWLRYSVSFNADKIHTPLLMEEMGYGVTDDNEQMPPLNLIQNYELFTGLNRLHRAVELYYYPYEQHQPDHPQARLESLQRNLDWYSFWLMGSEREKPEDREQYDRWRSLRLRSDRTGMVSP